jgi:hypothetical protein
MRVYVYFASSDTVAVARCSQLMNQAAGSHMVEPDASENPAYPGWTGVPVGKGSEAPPNNLGCNLVEAVRQAVLAGEVENLSESERVELLVFFGQGVELDHTWTQAPEEE